MQNFKKIPFISIAVVIIIVAILSGIIWFLSQETKKNVEGRIIEEIARQESIIADQTTQFLEVEIADTEEKLSFIAQIPEVRDGDSEACGKKLKQIFDGMRLKLNNIGRMNKDGIFYCGVVDSIIGVDGKEYEYLRKIINDPTHQSVLSRGVVFKYTDYTKYLVALHVPVFDKNGVFAGTLGGAIYLDEFQEKYFKNIAPVRGSYIVLFDDNGDILYHPNLDFVGRNINDEYMQKILSESRELQDLVKDAQKGLIGTKKYIYQGESKLAAYQPARLIDNRYWPVIVTIPISNIDVASLVSKLYRQYFIIFGIFILVALSIVIFLARLNKILIRKVEERTAELEIAKNKSEVMLASIGDGVFAIDKESNIIHFNKRAEEISGYKTSEVLGKPYYDFLKFIKEKDRNENIGFIRTAIRGETSIMTDHTVLIRKDKKELPVADSAAPIKDQQGKVLGAIVVFHDATQEREIERIRAELISLTGHQLKTPLTAISGYLEMLKESELSTEAKKYMDEIEQGVKTMVELVSDVLNISRIEQGKIEIKPEPTRLEEIVDSLIRDLSLIAKKRKITIEFKKPSEPLSEVNVDPKYLREAIQNIISNAINYTKDKVVISLEKIDNNLRFSCFDNGIGIPKYEQSKIFTKFFRASNTTQTGVEGTGLGLSITKAIIEQHKGRIWFESDEGRGTTFYVTLPFI